MATLKPKTYAKPDKKSVSRVTVVKPVIGEERETYRELRNRAVEMFRAAADSRRRYDWEW